MILDHVIHQDTDIIVLNKPGGLLSVPGVRIKDSAFSRLTDEVGELHIVHRLDQDTSGIIVYARHKNALRHIQQQFERQTTEKIYESVVTGSVGPRTGCINLPIRVDWDNRPKQIICHTEGRYALTRWEKMSQTDTTTRLALFPKTGRSHQLRVHLQQIGHAIIGDPFYSKAFDRTKTPMMCLHARQLTFNHPGTQQRMTIECPPPF